MNVVHHNEFEFDAVKTACGVDFVNSHLRAVFDSLTVNACAARERAGRADIEFRVVCCVICLFCAARSKCKCRCGEHHERKSEANEFFHIDFLLFVSAEFYGVEFYIKKRPCGCRKAVFEYTKILKNKPSGKPPDFINNYNAPNVNYRN